MTDRGFLILADISGFTAFVTSTELEHGPQVVAALLETVMTRLSPPLEIQELEGDAVFALGPDGGPVQPLTLFELLEDAFVAFKDRQRQMVLGTTCSCNACRSISRLDLKLIVHHGQFIRQVVGGKSQAAGAEVILAHNLLKNHVMGPRAYMLLTKAALAETGVDPGAAGMREHVESYGHFGDVRCVVHDLESVWRRTTEARVVRVEPANAIFTIDVMLPVSPAVAWDWLFSPDKIQRYEATTKRIVQESGAAGRPGVGTRIHCAHTNEDIVETILDWRPFRYCTRDATRRPGNLTVRYTTDLAAQDGGTRVTTSMALPPATPWWKRSVIRLLAPRVRTAFEANLRALERLLGERRHSDQAI